MGIFRKLTNKLFGRSGSVAGRAKPPEELPRAHVLDLDEERIGPSEVVAFRKWVQGKEAEKRAGRLDRGFPITPQQWRIEQRDRRFDKTIERTKRHLKRGHGRTHLEKFLDGDVWLETPQSSNVAKFKFEPPEDGKEHGRLRVVFKDGNTYLVYRVTDLEARNWYHASSKGKWYWDHVRVRGTKLGHKKPYEHVSHGPTVRRKWVDRGADSIADHLDQVKAESSKHGAEGVVPASYLDSLGA